MPRVLERAVVGCGGILKVPLHDARDREHQAAEVDDAVTQNDGSGAVFGRSTDIDAMNRHVLGSSPKPTAIGTERERPRVADDSI